MSAPEVTINAHDRVEVSGIPPEGLDYNAAWLLWHRLDGALTAFAERAAQQEAQA